MPKKAVCWVVDGAKLTARRIARGLTSDALARRAGLSERTVRRYESGETKLAKVEHLRYVARVLQVSVDAIASPEEAPAPLTAPASAPPGPVNPYTASLERAKLLSPTQLESIVELESRLPPPRQVDYEGTPITVLTARKLQNVFSAFATFEGERFAVNGVVAKSRGASVPEVNVMGCRLGVAVRFMLVREISDGVDIQVTVHTAHAKTTRTLLRVQEEEREACAIVKVVLVPEAMFEKNEGFEFFLSPRPRPWGFVVEAVV